MLVGLPKIFFFSHNVFIFFWGGVGVGGGKVFENFIVCIKISSFLSFMSIS